MLAGIAADDTVHGLADTASRKESARNPTFRHSREGGNPEHT
jgi:hypothetical protein